MTTQKLHRPCMTFMRGDGWGRGGGAPYTESNLEKIDQFNTQSCWLYIITSNVLQLNTKKIELRQRITASIDNKEKMVFVVVFFLLFIK